MSRIQNENFKTQAELEAQGLTESEAKEALLHDSKVYITADGLNKRLDEAILDGDIGGGGAGVGGVDIAFVQTFDAQEIEDFEDEEGLTFETTNPLRGEASARLVHDASVEQFFKQLIPVDQKFRAQSMIFALDVRSAANAGNVELVVTDETNAAVLVDESLKITATATGEKNKFLIFIPLNCASLSYEVKALTQSGTPATVVDDVILEKYNPQIHDIVTGENTVLLAQVTTSGITLTGGVTDVPYINTIIDTENAWSGTRYTVKQSGVHTVSASVRYNSNLTIETQLFVNGTLSKWLGTVTSNSTVPGTYTGHFNVGDEISIRSRSTATSAASPNNIPEGQYISITRVNKARNIITQMETFSTDTAPLTYAPSSSYTFTTIEDAPKGTFVTGFYAASSFAITQTTTAPTQTIADMNANGIRVWTRGYTEAGSANEPEVFAIQIGKNLKGINLSFFKSSSKAEIGSLDFVTFGTNAQYGARIKEYNPDTGVFTIDASMVNSSTYTTALFRFNDGTNQNNGYLVINASKNPAVAGLTYPLTCYLKDVKSSGTRGGSVPATSTWFTRTLNTVEGSLSFVTLNSNQFTLPKGKYLIDVSAPAFRVELYKIRLRNITDSSTTLDGTSERAENTASNHTRSFLIGEINLAATKTFEVQQIVSFNPSTTAALGFDVNQGPEIYTQVKITKLE